MHDFLSKMIGKKVDIVCVGSPSLRGEILRVDGGVLQMKDEDDGMCFIAIDKIAIVWEARGEHTAGFVATLQDKKAG